jgi:hypothetical protein
MAPRDSRTSVSTPAWLTEPGSSRYTPDSLTREFVDGDGVRWTVREIIPEPRATLHRTLLTRPGYENGWLSFRSSEMACRIAPFPQGWRSISDYEMERWCMKARDRARNGRTKMQGGEQR